MGQVPALLLTSFGAGTLFHKSTRIGEAILETQNFRQA
jgi:hypothetical protein